MKLYKEESEALIKIVNNVFLVNILDNNRSRDTVDARYIYSKIFREKGCPYQSIGDSINKNHATIVHYIKNVDSIMTYDKRLRDRYITCKVLFYDDREVISNEFRKDVDIYTTAVRLKGELQKAISDKNNVLNDFIDYIEEYQKIKGHLPSIDYYRSTILPKFDV